MQNIFEMPMASASSNNAILVETTSRTVKEGSESVLKFQAKKLTCHHFMDAGRRHGTPGSEINDSITVSSSQNIGILQGGLPRP